MLAVLLDTNVLWPSLQRDFLLSLAIEGLYRVLWSEAILGELEYYERRKLLDRGGGDGESTGRAAHLIASMRRAFPDASVQGWEPLDGSYGLPDADDEHVVAAAVVGGADVIVTENRKDFPAEHLPDRLQVVSAAEFVHDTARLDPAAASRALQAISSRYTAPPHTPIELIAVLDDRYGMSDVATVLRGCL